MEEIEYIRRRFAWGLAQSGPKYFKIRTPEGDSEWLDLTDEEFAALAAYFGTPQPTGEQG